MPDSYDLIVAGAGLAGATAALERAARERVLVLDACLESDASRIPMGLISPLLSRRARPVWRLGEAMEALEEMLSETGAGDLLQKGGVLKPARDPEQARDFEDAALRWPAHGAWYESPEAQALWPGVSSPHGALHVVRGAALNMGSLLDRILVQATTRGAVLLRHRLIKKWTEEADRVIVSTRNTVTGEEEEISAKRLIMAIGGGYREFPDLSRLDLHRIKGQWIQVRFPESVQPAPPVSAYGYCATDQGLATIGSTYEHVFDNLEPTPDAARVLLDGAARMIPAIQEAPVVAAGAAVRVTVPGIRLPMVGLVPGHNRTWLLTGLGSKGLLLAPYLARSLEGWFRDPDAVDSELRIRHPKRTSKR
jgi:glycine/D-amino acid oxidase-like deaminating enzyme